MKMYKLRKKLFNQWEIQPIKIMSRSDKHVCITENNNLIQLVFGPNFVTQCCCLLLQRHTTQQNEDVHSDNGVTNSYEKMALRLEVNMPISINYVYTLLLNVPTSVNYVSTLLLVRVFICETCGPSSYYDKHYGIHFYSQIFLNILIKCRLWRPN